MLRRLPLLLLLLPLGAAHAAGSLSSGGWSWPSAEQWWRLLSLQDYNTRVVLLGAMLLGLASGIIGCFMLLRKRSLMGDAVSHATLPGIAIAFLVMVAAGGTGKHLPGLLLGALLAGLVGMLAVTAIQATTRLKADAALGIVLSVFFGAGIALLGIIQRLPSASAAGLSSFINGKTASMLSSDAWVIAGGATAVILVCGLCFKEFALLCFDPAYSRAAGLRVTLLDLLMMGLIVAVTVIGLQAVGLILVIALLVIPPAAARFWTDRLLPMVLIAAGLGAASCLAGAGLSALQPDLPAGAIIVTTAALAFALSLIAGPAHGLLVRGWAAWRLNQSVARQHLLRAFYESWEDRGSPSGDQAPLEATWAELLADRSWTAGALRRHLAWAVRQGLVEAAGEERYRLTASGRAEAHRLVRNHRLWELYLITFAEVATSRVDRDADRIEHVLEPALVSQLETRLREQYPHLAMPLSPHPHLHPEVAR